MLESTIRDNLVKKDILLMTHIVLGYPSFEESFRLIETMVEAGVDLMELQIPFSEPIADGPVILRANQVALQRGVKIQESMDFAGKVVSTFPIPFLIMSYYNILFRKGVASFVSSMAERGIQGAIVPDLPPEEGKDYLEGMDGRGLSPIRLFSPTTSPTLMAHIASRGRGFIYCVARRGVTGAKTRFSQDLTRYLGDCRRATHLPLALGFGVGGKRDIDFLKGKADIAVIGSRVIRILDREGIKGVSSFIWGLLARDFNLYRRKTECMISSQIFHRSKLLLNILYFTIVNNVPLLTSPFIKDHKAIEIIEQIFTTKIKPESVLPGFYDFVQIFIALLHLRVYIT